MSEFLSIWISEWILSMFNFDDNEAEVDDPFLEFRDPRG